MNTRSPQTKSRSALSRRRFLEATALTGVAAAIGPRTAKAAGGKVVVGTWGGDYQNLIQKNISAPLLQPQGVEVIYDTDNDSPRKTKMMAQKMLPHGTMDVSALNRAGSYEMYKAGTLLEIDTSKIPNYSHVLPKLATTWSVSAHLLGPHHPLQPEVHYGEADLLRGSLEPEIRGPRRHHRHPVPDHHPVRRDDQRRKLHRLRARQERS